MSTSRIFAVLAIMSLAACSSRTVSDFGDRVEVDPGWHHTWNEYRNSVYFGFVDPSKTFFWGTCGIRPIFMLSNGDYGFAVKAFTLTVDKQQWHLDAFQGEHGRALVIDDPKIVDALYNAKNVVRFRVDDGWTREFKPADDLSQMIEECRSLRAVDPDARGRLARYQTP